MTRPAAPKVPPDDPSHHRAADASPSLGRDALERLPSRFLKHGGPTKADLYVVEPDGSARMVVKDFARKAWWVRLIGRIQIGREVRAYRWLGSTPGVARLIGRVDAHALALEWIEGEELASSPRRAGRGPELLEQLAVVVRRLHARGLAHLDLRGRENVMLNRQGEIRVLDFAAAIRFRPGGWAHRLLFGWFKLADDAALLKWKGLLQAGPYTADEQAFLRRFAFYRSLWVFNRKRGTDGNSG